jgi:hypothetical protein
MSGRIRHCEECPHCLTQYLIGLLRMREKRNHAPHSTKKKSRTFRDLTVWQALSRIIQRLSKSFPPSRSTLAALPRGTELVARMTIEHAGDRARWKSLIDVLSKEGNHGSFVRMGIAEALSVRYSGPASAPHKA